MTRLRVFPAGLLLALVSCVASRGRAVRPPVILAPREVAACSPFSASMVADGFSPSWAVTGGTLDGPGCDLTVHCQATASILTLLGTVSDKGRSSTSSWWVVGLPFVPRDYLADFRGHLATYASGIESEVATGDCEVWYGTSYYLMGLAAAAEASGDVAIMDQLVALEGQMMDLAQPIVRGGRTYQEFGPWDADGLPQILDTFQATGPLARTAAIIKRRPEFRVRYAAVGQRLTEHVDQSIFGFWFDKQTGYYRDPLGLWLGGTIPWLPVEFGGWGSYPYWSDKASHLGMMAAWMYEATGNDLYREYAERIGRGFRTHTAVQDGCLLWDLGTWPIQTGQNLAGVPDTSHANREPMMAVAMYELGIEFAIADLQGMGNTLALKIWNQDVITPRFSNYIDGENLLYRGYPAWTNGNIAFGWDALGRYVPEAQRALAIACQADETLGYSDPSDRWNASPYGLIEMSGVLALNVSDPASGEPMNRQEHK